MYRRTQEGFTLIEILIVVTIIAILAAVVFASLGDSRARARDTARQSDIQQMSVALRAFFEAHDRFPSSADGSCAHNTSFGPNGCMQVLVEEGYFDQLPQDPSHDPENNQMYYYNNWCRGEGTVDTQYRLWTNGELYDDADTDKWWHEYTIGATTCEDPS